MSKRYPKAYAKQIIKDGEVFIVPTEEAERFDTSTIPRFNEDAIFLDERTVGSIAEALPANKVWANANNHQIWSAIRQHGWSTNPITKLPRAIGLLLKLEEMGLKGDIDAIKLYLDRTCGKQAEGLAVGLTEIEKMSDQEILSQLHKSGMSNIVQSSLQQQTADTSQKNGAEDITNNYVQ